MRIGRSGKDQISYKVFLFVAILFGSQSIHAGFPAARDCGWSGAVLNCQFKNMPALNQNEQYDPQGRQGGMCAPTSWTSIFRMLRANGLSFSDWDPVFDNSAWILPSRIADALGTKARGSNSQNWDGKLAPYVNRIRRTNGQPAYTRIIDSTDWLARGQFSTYEVAIRAQAAQPTVLNVGRYQVASRQTFVGMAIVSYHRGGGHAMAVSGSSIDYQVLSWGDVDNSSKISLMDPERVHNNVWFAPLTAILPRIRAWTNDGVINRSSGYGLLGDQGPSTRVGQLIIPESFSFIE